MQIANFSELTPFFETFLAESDRACGILSGVLLDSMLESLLRKVMLPTVPNDVFAAQGVLASFSSKINVAYYLGHISNDEFTELHLIRKIRNDFAHAIDHNLTFSTPPVSDRIQHLRFPKILIDYSYLAEKPPKDEELKAIRDQPRKRFEISVGTITHLLTQRVAASQTPNSPRGLADMIAGVPAKAT